MKDQDKTLLLIRAAKKIEKLGYEVYIAQPSFAFPYPCYGYITDNEHKHVGYFQVVSFGTGITFATMHKAGYGIGTSFSSDREEVDHLLGMKVEDITKEDVEATFAVAPNWAKREDFERALKAKYKSFDEFMELYWNNNKPLLFTKALEAKLRKIIKNA